MTVWSLHPETVRKKYLIHCILHRYCVPDGSFLRQFTCVSDLWRLYDGFVTGECKECKQGIPRLIMNLQPWMTSIAQKIGHRYISWKAECWSKIIADI